eukprot:gene2811-3103_t
MDFWKKAQAAAEKLINSEAAAEMARIAQQATQQAAALAKEATEKAQAEAPGSTAPLHHGITPELEQFVRSLTYSTFSDYPLDSLDVPAQPEQQKLDSWQETHARLLLEQVPQLQDLRFVLCPKGSIASKWWFKVRSVPAGVSPAMSGGVAAAAAASDGWQADGAEDEDVDDVDVDAELAALADDPELDAYLQGALQLDGAVDGAAEEDHNGGADGEGDDLEDLDDYVHQLDAGAPQRRLAVLAAVAPVAIRVCLIATLLTASVSLAVHTGLSACGHLLLTQTIAADTN